MGSFLALVILLLSRKLGDVFRLLIEGDLLLEEDLEEYEEQDEDLALLQVLEGLLILDVDE